MDLSIVIVSWNVKEKLRECLKSIRETVGPPPPLLPPLLTSPRAGEECGWQGGNIGLEYEVFVVDNNSKDTTVEMVEKEFPEFFVIANKENFGFAKANNQAIRLSQGRYVLLLNPDMRLLPGTLEKMVKFMDENKEVGVAGCHLISPSPALRAPSPQGRGEGEGYTTVPQVRRFPRLSDQLAIMLKLPHLFPRVLDGYMMKDFDYSQEARVDSIRGSFFMIRREVLDKIGLLDDNFFVWFEEVDFCKRAIEAGYKVAYTPIAKCVDYVGQSFKQVKFYPKQKMLTRSMVYYFKKHAPWWQWGLLWCLRPFVLVAAWVGDHFIRH